MRKHINLSNGVTFTLLPWAFILAAIVMLTACGSAGQGTEPVQPGHPCTDDSGGTISPAFCGPVIEKA